MAKSATKSKPAPVEVEQTVLTFNLVKETKGALRYEQEGYDEKNMDAVLIGTLYLRKAHIDGTDYPQTVSMTLSF